MKIEIEKTLLQDYCDIASFIFDVNMHYFYKRIEKDMLSILVNSQIEEDEKYRESYDAIYDNICNGEYIRIVALKWDDKYSIGIFGDYANNGLIIINEDRHNEINSKYGLFSTDHIIDILCKLRCNDRDDIIGE